MNNNQKLTFIEKASYGIASLGDAAVYNFIGLYFLFFLTTVAGVNPGIAGTISSVALAVGIFSNIFVGYASDNSKAKRRRTPYIFASIIPLIVAFICMHTAVNLDGIAQVIYYGAFACLFWIAYSAFYVPYTALGAEITSDYDDRTRIRSYSSWCNMVGNLLGMVSPMIIITFLNQYTNSDATSWTLTTTFIGIIAGLTILAMILKLKSREKRNCFSQSSDQAVPKHNIIVDYFEAIKIKPFKYIVLLNIFSMIAYSAALGSLQYFVVYKLGLPQYDSSKILLVGIIAGLIYVSIFSFIATKIGKRAMFIFGVGGVGILMLLVGQVIGITSFSLAIIFQLIGVAGGTLYWMLAPAVLYDITEVLEFKYGKRSEGILTSLHLISQQIGSSLSVLIIGWVLDFVQFDAELTTQTDLTMMGINFVAIGLPALGYLLAVIVMIFFPINKKTFELLQNALAKKKAGENYSTDGLKRII